MTSRRRVIGALGLLLHLVAGCSGPAPTATPIPTPTPQPITTEKVSFTTEDGVALSGTLFPGGGDLAVVLAHQGAGQPSQKSWHTFATLAAQHGFTALPFDFRVDFGGPLDRDVVAAIRFLIEDPRASGVLNLTAPQPLTGRDFGRAIGRVMGRPAFLPIPAIALRLVFGEVSTVILDGQRVLPSRLLDLGFRFRFPDADTALRDLLSSSEG